MIAFLVAVFLVIFGIALYSPVFIASFSTQNSARLSVTPLHNIHSNNDVDLPSSAVQVVNYTGIFYIQHVCMYNE